MSFDFQPTLTGDLLELRPLCRDDFAALYRVAADPLLWEQHPSTDRYQHTVFTTFFHDALASGGALLVSERRAGHAIGSSRFANYDSQRSEVEIGWTFLARAYWGGTYNRELKRLMLTHAFGVVETVVFLIGPHNLRSQRAVEKIGGVRAGTRPDGRGQKSLEYRITAAEFAAAKLM